VAFEQRLTKQYPNRTGRSNQMAERNQ